MASKKRRKNRRPADNVMAGTGFRPVPGLLGYYVNEEGRPLSVCELSVHLHDDGYLRVHAFDANSKRIRPGIHTLIALAFLPPPLPGQDQVRHLNGNRTDNRPENLAWGTAKTNGEDKAAHGTCKGERNGRARLGEDDVRVIRSRYDAGESCQSIADDYGVSDSTIDAIGKRRNWKWLK